MSLYEVLYDKFRDAISENDDQMCNEARAD